METGIAFHYNYYRIYIEREMCPYALIQLHLISRKHKCIQENNHREDERSKM